MRPQGVPAKPEPAAGGRRARLRRAALRAPGPGYGRDPAICCRKARILCELCIVYRAGL